MLRTSSNLKWKQLFRLRIRSSIMLMVFSSEKQLQKANGTKCGFAHSSSLKPTLLWEKLFKIFRVSFPIRQILTVFPACQKLMQRVSVERVGNETQKSHFLTNRTFNGDVRADRNGARLPACLPHFPGRLADRRALWKWGFTRKQFKGQWCCYSITTVFGQLTLFISWWHFKAKNMSSVNIM